ncbi:MAG: hypothetical protein HUK20_01670, partial [Fibrobacter sp.]|nr:hypothetical protein [Fibrobacter sp.]
EISEEEYENQKLEIKKKAAREEYKINMLQWTANLLAGQASVALAIANALATQPFMVGMVMAGLAAAAGAVQIASIVASKPTPPTFATGGFVPGTSYSGDNVIARVNSGEAVLNAAQQRNFMNLANGGAGGGMSVIINNSASNIVSAQPRITKEGIELMIDARVNNSLQRGRYDSSLTMANEGMSGEYYGI